MPRYCKQILESDCGPIAVMNALKWAGINVTMKEHYKSIREDVNWTPMTDPVAGTYRKDMIPVLRAHGLIVKSVTNPTLKQLEDHVRLGGCFIFNHNLSWGKGHDTRHFAFCDEIRGSRFVMYNSPYKVSKTIRSKKTVLSFLKLKNLKGYFSPPVALMIRMKG